MRSRARQKAARFLVAKTAEAALYDFSRSAVTVRPTGAYRCPEFVSGKSQDRHSGKLRRMPVNGIGFRLGIAKACHPCVPSPIPAGLVSDGTEVPIMVSLMDDDSRQVGVEQVNWPEGRLRCQTWIKQHRIHEGLRGWSWRESADQATETSCAHIGDRVPSIGEKEANSDRSPATDK